MKLFHFERRHEPLASRNLFGFRLFQNFLFSALIVGAVLGLGMWGYSKFLSLTAIDAWHNAARIFSGMDAANEAQNWQGKFFVITYALTTKLTEIIATTVFLAPVLHRILHWFHIDQTDR